MCSDRTAADLCGVPRAAAHAVPDMGDACLHAGGSDPAGFAAAGIFRKALRYQGAAGNGRARGHRAGSVCSAPDGLSMDHPDGRTLAYLVSLPFGYLSYRGYQERAREAKAETATSSPAAPTPPAQSPTAATAVHPLPDQGRPSRLN